MRLLLVLFAFALLATVSPAAARCRPALGYGLVRVGDGDVAPGGTVLVALRRVYAEPQVIDLPLTSLRIRGGRRPTTVTPRQLAANLFAITLPASAGRYRISPGRLTVNVTARAAAAATPAAAPTFAASPIGSTMIGTEAWAPTLELAATPAEAAGVVLTWDNGSWFVPSGETMIGPGRCTPVVPGFDPVDAGDQVSARFVGVGGGLSPEASFTAAAPVAR